MLDRLEHMKEWAMQDHGSMTARQIADAVVRICDDGIREIRAAELLRAVDKSDTTAATEKVCSSCGAVEGECYVWCAKN